MTLSTANRQHTRKINLRLLKQIAEALLAELKIQNAEVEINLVAATAMTRLNEKFLQHAGPTDVLTFDYANQGGQGFVATPNVRATTKRCPPLHGEIFICVDEAILQAGTYRTGWQSEIIRYLIHGVLHLLGHDDSTAGKRHRMKQEESRLLRGLSRRFSLAQLGGTPKIPACTSR